MSVAVQQARADAETGDGWFREIDGASLDEARLAREIAAALPGAQALHVRGVRAGPDPTAFWLRIGKTVGEHADVIEDSVTGVPRWGDGRWMDVRFEPDRADSFRHHNSGQPLHTDGAYVDFDLGLALFYLERQAEAGGDSLFIDAAGVEAAARRLDPGLHHRLTTLPVRFGKAGGPGRRTEILSRRDGRWKINWNYYRVLPDQGPEAAALREDFAAFLERLIEEGVVRRFLLAPGDALFFRDDEVLHGRAAFAARESGDRLLWKTYFRLRGHVGGR